MRAFLLGRFTGEKMSAPTKQEMLENVENAINARMSGGAVQSYSIGGRNLQYITLSELMKLRDKLRQEVSSLAGRTAFAKFERPV
jgi:hypothetical protein